MAKALGGGFPLSAIGARAELMATIRAGDHGSTFGGNPVSCAAALAGIDAMEAEGLPEHARILGERAIERLAALDDRHEGVRVRGLGLMIGIEVTSADGLEPRPDLAEAVRRRALDEGVLVICSGPEANVIRVLPPLVITDSELDRALAVLEGAIDAELAGAGGAGQPRPSSSR
jgi:4-aminobutyrate aminotransferase/(S)-3-amino-2-methylpropionate transaminase